MKAGFAKIPILPEGPTSLAGYAERMPRHYTQVLDPVYARAAAFSEDQHGVVVISADFLTPQERLTQAMRLHLVGRLPAGVDVVLHATHTHSAPGNFWSHPIAKKFAGPFKQETFDFLARRFADVAEWAWKNRDHVRVGFAQEQLPGLQGEPPPRGRPDRRDADERRFFSPDGRPVGAMVQYAGHPVIVSENEFFAVSADYPGRVAEAIEKEFPTCLFLNGAVGGLSIWFPKERIPVSDHLKKVATPIAEGLAKQLTAMKPERGKLAFSRRHAELPDVGAQPFPPDYAWWTPAAMPAVSVWNHFVGKGFFKPRRSPVSAVRLGEAAFVFHPSDFGVGGGLRTRENARAVGLNGSPVGHTDDYAGYIHPEEEMLIPPKAEGEYRYMTIYENLMGFHGRGAYALFEKAEKEALADIASV
ncbi:MAG: hypothetical protein M5R36_26660 [Deltaproteobacteria bacterium]|nr:hypothetical protein [Deltaproteobacteria bacterium]